MNGQFNRLQSSLYIHVFHEMTVCKFKSWLFIGSKTIHGKMYSTPYYVMKFVSDLRQVDVFLWVLFTELSPSFTQSTNKHYILRHCSNIMLIQQYKNINRSTFILNLKLNNTIIQLSLLTLPHFDYIV
jgi:hypothetical protein